MKTIELANGKVIGEGQRPYIIAELNSSHNGNVATAKDMIQAALDAGCDCVKLQSWSPKSLYSKSYYDVNPIAKRIVAKFALAPEQLLDLARFSCSIGIDFSSTPYARDEADFLLDDCQASFVKVASMDINNYGYLAYIAQKGKPIFLSTGMAELDEIKRAVEVLEQHGARRLVIFHCVSIYPTPPSMSQLNNIGLLKQEFPEHVIGFSDHSLGTAITHAAIAMGAEVIEKHFSLDNSKIGMDNNMAIEPAEMKQLVAGCHAVSESLGSAQRQVPEQELVQRANMRRSVIAAVPIAAGEVISQQMLDAKRPGTGIPVDQLENVVGKVALRDIEADTLIATTDLQDFQQ